MSSCQASSKGFRLDKKIYFQPKKWCNSNEFIFKADHVLLRRNVRQVESETVCLIKQHSICFFACCYCQALSWSICGLFEIGNHSNPNCDPSPADCIMYRVTLHTPYTTLTQSKSKFIDGSQDLPHSLYIWCFSACLDVLCRLIDQSKY